MAGGLGVVPEEAESRCGLLLPDVPAGLGCPESFGGGIAKQNIDARRSHTCTTTRFSVATSMGSLQGPQAEHVSCGRIWMRYLCSGRSCPTRLLMVGALCSTGGVIEITHCCAVRSSITCATDVHMDQRECQCTLRPAFTHEPPPMSSTLTPSVPAPSLPSPPQVPERWPYCDRRFTQEPGKQFIDAFSGTIGGGAGTEGAEHED